MIRVEILRLNAVELAAGGFKHDVKVRSDAESGAHRCIFNLTWTEVVEHRGMTVQERLDVEKLPGPASFLEDALAAGQPSGF
jgi:hypothetical protein